MKNKKLIVYNSAFKLFLNKEVPYRMLVDYIEHPYDEQANRLQDFIGVNMKSELLVWSTAIGIMDAVDILYKEALNNGNLNDLWN